MEAIIVAIISASVTLIGIFVSAKGTRDRVAHELEKQNALQNQEIQRIKEDIKEHNHYAKLFAESMPVVQEQIKVINHRIDDLERITSR